MAHAVFFVSDVHAGSTMGLCTPEGAKRDDGGWFLPSNLQLELWDHWIRTWSVWAPELIERYKPTTTQLVLNGDMTDGDHHRTTQLITAHEGEQIRVAHNVLERGPLALDVDAIHVTRGTPAHVGRAGGFEEGLARVLAAEGYPIVFDELDNASSYHRRFYAGDKLIDVKHHGRMGARQHTRGPYLRWYARDIQAEHIDDGIRPPDIAIRAHHHTHGDSGRDHKMVTRLITQPCWQLSTEYAYRIAIERLPDIGAIAVIVEDDGFDRLFKHLLPIERPEPYRVEDDNAS